MPNAPAAGPAGSPSSVGPYGPYGPPAPPPGPFDQPGPGGPGSSGGRPASPFDVPGPGGSGKRRRDARAPKKKGRGGLIGGLIAAGVMVAGLVVLAGAAFSGAGGSGDDIDGLPAPTVLGHDPVPPEKTITKRPARCGISKATVKALAPGRTGSRTGGDCRWSNRGAADEVALSVDYQPAELGYHQQSRAAAAIEEYGRDTAVRPGEAPYRPLTGLGDEAAVRSGKVPGAGTLSDEVVFRSGDLVTTVLLKGRTARTSTPKTHLRGTLRAVREVARALGVPARPAVAQDANRAPVAVPGDVCALVPESLTETLGDDDSPYTRADSTDSLIDDDAIPSARTEGCRAGMYTGDDDYRILQVHVTGPAKPGADAAVRRAYLAAYDEARAERPAGGGGRYFQALSGLGDEAFCSYVDGERDSAVYGNDVAEVVVRSGTALITVTFGGGSGDSGLSGTRTVNGAYAAAKKVTAAVK